ncbi:PepSY-like domain-containing protein [Adhaeribacter sp. BT258]|uniref:PepSY-like domain-containing protein n=1 Tax=Adhaeribacter terrigena TaxID=2793070 RepID=A0ABS1C2R6_9BACT|nr:PepSY-like domain-containing protein [Adhaeribacter terrigena]MBK0403634.1 PepSY-like domain-containing protein [Adhaeribacter terrigena]
MKALTLALFLGTSSLFATAQDIKETEVPSVVMNSFKSQFTDAQKPEWEKLNDKYEVEFEQGTAERSVVLDASGKVLMQKLEIENTEVPAAIANALKQNYNGYELDEAEKIEYNGQTYYEVELSRWFVLSKELVFSADGKETTLPF